MDDVWDVIILFLIAGITGGILFFGVTTLFKQSVQKTTNIKTPTSRPLIEAQTLKAEQTRRDQEQLLREQRRLQDQMRRDTQQKIRDMQR